MKLMATIIPFPGLNETDMSLEPHSDAQGDASPNFANFIGELQAHLAELKAQFLIVQNGLDSIVQSENDDHTY